MEYIDQAEDAMRPTYSALENENFRLKEEVASLERKIKILEDEIDSMHDESFMLPGGLSVEKINYLKNKKG